jgi:AmiR/NasT family two-component response regulator
MTTLDDLGKKHRRLLRELEELKPQLHEAIRTERAAGTKQRELMERSGYKTIQQIRVITGEAERK